MILVTACLSFRIHAASLVYSLRGGLFEVYDDGTLKVSGGTGWHHGSGTPEGTVTAPVGSFYADTGGGGMYYKSSGAGNTGWTLLATGAGLTINPTTGYTPYRSGASTFGDSPWYRISANQMGFNGTSQFLISSNYNIGLGAEAMGEIGSGSLHNFAAGYQALKGITSGEHNVAIGYQAAKSLSSGELNVFVGYQAGYRNSSPNLVTGSENQAIGTGALSKLTSGGANTAIGGYALYLNQTGGNNVAIGYQAADAMDNSFQNVVVGVAALTAATTSSDNSALGYEALRWQTTGDKNSAVGAYSGHRMTLGTRNSFLGYGAGTNSTTGNDLVLLGASAKMLTNTDTNAIGIGSGVVVGASNTAQIGTNGVSVLYLNGTVGWYRGSGSPEGVVPANIGSFYSREDGSTDTALYRKETGTGNTGWAAVSNGGGVAVSYGVAASDETTALTTGTGKVTFRMPHAMTLTAVRASLTTAQTSGSTFTVDINENGTTILSTKLTVDNTEKTSTTAATPPVISDTALADDAEITVDIDTVGDGTATGLKVWIIGTRTP